jgi:hypothetical protein
MVLTQHKTNSLNFNVQFNYCKIETNYRQLLELIPKKMIYYSKPPNTHIFTKNMSNIE